MNKQEAIDLLLSKGYKKEKYNIEPGCTSFYKRLQGACDCMCNNRAPNIGVELYELADNNGIMHNAMKIGLRAETTAGDWCDLNWYGMAFSRLDSLSEFEYLLENAWNSLN